MTDFIEIQAKAYETAPLDPAPWVEYVKAIERLWGTRRVLPVAGNLLCIRPVPVQEPYCDAHQLRRRIQATGIVDVWDGGNFSADHPLLEKIWTFQEKQFVQKLPAYMISRAYHDIDVHFDRNFSFDPLDELRAAGNMPDFNEDALKAAWTDDVAMTCYRVYTGSWPEIQEPRIVEPDWKGLRNFVQLP